MSGTKKGRYSLHVGVASGADIESSLDVANVLHDAGAQATVYLSKSRARRLLSRNDGSGSDQDLGGRLYKLNLVPEAVSLRLIDYPRMRDLRSLATVRQVAQAMRDDGVHVVHLSIGPGEVWLGVMALALRDVPVVTAFQQPVQNVGDGRPGAFTTLGNRLATWGSDVNVVHGRQLATLLIDRYRLRAERVAHVPLLPRITAARWPASNRPEEPGTVLFFGGARYHKGLEYLVRAQPLVTREVPDAHFVIAAHGPDLERCLALIQEPDRFEVHEGFVPGEEMPGFFERASLVVLPYIDAAASGVLLDAYSFGRPVVASRVGALPDYVEEGVTGLLVPPADERALARAIISLLKDDRLRHQMAEQAKRWVGKQRQAIVAQWLQVYLQAIDLHGNGNGADAAAR
jgi:glycosyltransferase involved in cell wall biosynthesis